MKQKVEDKITSTPKKIINLITIDSITQNINK